MTPPLKTGPEAIREALKTIPHAPGVYRMIGADDRMLYIGKAKDLHKRVSSYALARDLSRRLMTMIAHIARIEHTVTESEAEALLVEANFVRRYQPRYNILLKDDKSFPYLLIGKGHAYPRIEKHRGAQNRPGEYFGPFASVGSLNEAMALLQKIFLLRPCNDTYFKNRTRPCLQYQIKRCSAPCVGYITPEAYGAQLARARSLLHGHHREVQDQLTHDMQTASEAMDFERAAGLRDQIRALTKVQQEQGMRTAGLDDADAVALARKGDRSVIMVSFYRQGGHFGQQSFQPRHEAEATDAEVMAAFLSQFYQSHTAPPEILVNLEPEECALLAEALSLNSSPLAGEARRGGEPDSPPLVDSPLTPALPRKGGGGYTVAIRLPQRGDKLKLIGQLEAAARAALAKVEMERASVAQNLLRLKELFGLKAAPARIEVYDNSHIMGTHAVGAFIVATPDGFDKRCYRTYNIKDTRTVPGDDYAMMREVFRRRFKGVAKGECDNLPDVVLIDGGLGQLNAVLDIVRELGVEGPVFVGIAKGQDRNAGREWLFMQDRAPFQLPVNDAALHYLQRLRDEAHRFAIGRHRNKRSKSLTASALDDIPGIGPGRKKALLLHFGSRADVERATLAELEKVKSINKATARAIYDFFHG